MLFIRVIFKSFAKDGIDVVFYFCYYQIGMFLEFLFDLSEENIDAGKKERKK